MTNSRVKLDEVRLRLTSAGYAAMSDLECRYEDGALVLSGTVPSYYLKQLAQERLRPLGTPIRNAILVVAADSRRFMRPV